MLRAIRPRRATAFSPTPPTTSSRAAGASRAESGPRQVTVYNEVTRCTPQPGLPRPDRYEAETSRHLPETRQGLGFIPMRNLLFERFPRFVHQKGHHSETLHH